MSKKSVRILTNDGDGHQLWLGSWRKKTPVTTDFLEALADNGTGHRTARAMRSRALRMRILEALNQFGNGTNNLAERTPKQMQEALGHASRLNEVMDRMLHDGMLRRRREGAVWVYRLRLSQSALKRHPAFLRPGAKPG